MNLKKIILISLILLVFSLTSVSATDLNATFVHSSSADGGSLQSSVELQDSNIQLSYLDPGSFKDLQEKVDNAPAGSVLDLYKDYNGKFKAKIHIEKDLTIDGHGHTLDCMNKESTCGFYSSCGNIILKNLKIINGNKLHGNDGLTMTGGAIYIFGVAKYTLDNCTLMNNNVEKGGGAICNKADTLLTIKNCQFISNKAHDNDGGAIYSCGNVYIENSLFKSNSVSCSGGAVYSEGDIEVINSTFESNQAKGALVEKSNGGAICGKKVVIDNCTFKNNYAQNRGGAVHASTITLKRTPSLFDGNTARDYGGAIYTDKFNEDIEYAIFSNNKAEKDDGGAIYINSENWITFTNCVFINNKCNDEGGAFYLDSSHSHLTLRNNVFIGNSADEGQAVYNCGYYDAVENNFWGNNNPSTDNDMLIEWKHAPYSNIHHVDNNPSKRDFRLDINRIMLNESC